MKLNYRKICLGLLVIGSALTFSSCKEDNDDPEFAMSDQEFVNRASSSNMFEIAAGNLAISKGVNAEIKSYGNHMVTDHSAEATEMMNLARSKGWNIPETMMDKERQQMEKLNNLTGNAFEKEFVNIMVMSHQDAVALFNLAGSPMGVPDPDLRTMANNKVPTLKMHLEHATALKTLINP